VSRAVRRLGLVLLAVGVTLATLELGAWALLAAGLAPAERAAPPTGPGPTLDAGVRGTPEALRPYVLHPYIGFVRNRDVARHELNGRHIDRPVNEHGFFGPAPPVGDDDSFVVALTGGSVALELYLRAGDALARALEALPIAAGRPVRLVSLALGGFKQPQQLAAVTYLLGRGHHLDLVLNLDGFNEAVLPATENRAQRISPDYPRMWRVYTARSIDADTAVLYGRVFEVKGRIEASRAFHARAPWRHSRFLHLLGRRSRARLAGEQARLEAALRESLAARELGPQESGPPYRYGPDMFGDFAALWRSASLQLWRLSRANEVAYVHLLQPSQYVAGSKPLTDAERRRAVAGPGTPYRAAVEAGYPALLREAEALRAADAPFVDLTGVFADEPATLYRDRCCHLNDAGYALLAAAVAEAVDRVVQPAPGR